MNVVQLDWSEACKSDLNSRQELGTILVFRIQLPIPAADAAEFRSLLTPSEERTMNRYAKPEDRLRFLAARGALRSILHARHGRAAASLEFHYSKEGKPSLAPTAKGSPLHFSISHSGQLVLLALCLDREIGIDVEQIAPHHDLLDIARLVFADPIVARLQSLPNQKRLHAFYRQWTRHEAALKAIGTGFSGQIKDIAPLGLHLHDLPAPPGYHVALAHRPR